MALGVGPDRIIYANPCKTPSFITFAAARGVKRMTFDNEMELEKSKNLCPDAEYVDSSGASVEAFIQPWLIG